jgi:ATP adenylyltransferase
MAEVRACQQLLVAARALVLKEDSTVLGFNLGINSGKVAGQTVVHFHVYLIPRRTGDNPNPRGGVHAVPDKAVY